MQAQVDTPAGLALPLPGGLFGSAAECEALRLVAEAHVSRARTMMHRARTLVVDDRVDAMALLTTRRTALGDHFGRYQRFKHGSIFDPVVEHGTASSRVVARTMKIDCMELGEIYAGYHARWLGVRPAEWRMYRRDMIATVDMLAINLEAELRAIRQLLMLSTFYGR